MGKYKQKNMKRIYLFLIISILFFSCTNNTKEEAKINIDSDIANTVISSTEFYDSTLFLISEQSMSYEFERIDSCDKVWFSGMNSIDISEYTKTKIDTTKIRIAFEYEHASIHGHWNNEVKNIRIVSFNDLPTFKGSEIRKLNWNRINSEFGFGFLILAKPIIIDEKYAFIGATYYCSDRFLSILYFLEKKENTWYIIDHDNSYLELVEAGIEQNTMSYPLHPISLVVIGKLRSVLKKNITHNRGNPDSKD